MEVTLLTNRAFRSRRGRTGGLTFLLLGVLAVVALSACGSPAYTYVADTSAGTFYKVPTQWHQISSKDLNASIKALGNPTAGVWSTAFDGNSTPSTNDSNSLVLSQPYVFAQVFTMSAQGIGELSYNAMRDWYLPVTATTRQEAAQAGAFAGTNFTPLRDQMISAKQGVHGVRETFQYTFGGQVDTFDDEVLTNADQTVLYIIEIHCTESCYSQNENNISTIMSSFTVGSPT